MALYIKPPSGTVSFNKLQNFVEQRLAFLYYIYDHTVDEITNVIEQKTLAENSDCLIEGTAKDKISHFTLRLICSSDSRLHDFFIETEIKLFRYRLKFCNFYKMAQMLSKASEQSKTILLNHSFILTSYHRLLKSLIFISEQIQNIIKEGGNFINVPFTSALKFVAERLYPLNVGFISLPVKDLKSFLAFLFHELLLNGLKQMKISLTNELKDSRMQYLLHIVKNWIFSKITYPVTSSSKRIINCVNLMEESNKFPLCMSNLFSELLKHHRLKHTSRIQFTLFLKEIGVTCSETIKLFMKEYSMPLVKTHEMSHSHCSHNWIENQNRYIYSIEHLYGIRGSHKNYKAHNCESLQNTYKSDGGCPFVTYDVQHLQKTLRYKNVMVKDIEDIITEVKEKKYNEACCLYLQYKVNTYQKENKENNINKERHYHSSLTNSSNASDVFFSFYNNGVGNHMQLSNLPKRFSSPSHFYSVLSSCID